ncbi:MAG: FAD-dependent oxidoreductase [Thermoleophilia bacterium]
MTNSLVVVGGGAGGLSAARAAVAMGVRPLLVSEGPLGGECTHTGCVPSKALIRAARTGEGFAGARERVDAAIARIAATEDEASLAREGIDVLRGRARFTAPGRLDMDGRAVSAPRVVLATGTRPVVPPIPGLDGVPVLTNENVFTLPACPSSLAVIGAGAVGCELAQAFARLGARVFLIERLQRLLAAEEPAASTVVTAALTRGGVTVHTGITVAEVGVTPDGVVLTLDDGSRVEVQRVLVAAGRRPAVEGLGLDRAGVTLTDSGHVRVDARLATSAPGVFAAGDVTGLLPFTHAADEMGRVAARNALSRHPHARFARAAVPWVTFTDPEVARVGLTEAQAAHIRGARVAEVPMSEVDRAVIEDRTEGFVRLIAGPRPVLGDRWGGRLLGATIVAPRAGEMIHEAALAMRTGMFTGRLAQTVHAYPTWSVAVRMAAAQFVTTVGGRDARPARATG